jgi:putative transposase
MPRGARQKSENSTYHIMSRSISEIDLFKSEEDKSYYLHLLKRYNEKYHCKIYAYSLMDNHVHLYINPCGYDISKYMLSLNTAYVSYFNRKHHRHGHLFQGRYASKIVDTDAYSLTLSAYIHNNAKDLPQYAGREQAYPYSSYGIYTGERKDTYKIVDTQYLLRPFSKDKQKARQKYAAFVASVIGTEPLKNIDEDISKAYTNNTYHSEKQSLIRYKDVNGLIKRVEHILEEPTNISLRTKHNRGTSKIRAFITYVMRVLCDVSYKELCQYIGNMSMSGVTRLTKEGFRLIQEEQKYKKAFAALT